MIDSHLHTEAISLLKNLIVIPSFSKEEGETAGILQQFFLQKEIEAHRVGNNVYALNKHFTDQKPTLLLNSHHDTVKPNLHYTRNPFEAIVEEGKLYGLGSNDAGGALVSLIAAFLHFYERDDIPFNVIMAATAEEEISGINGVELNLKHLPPIAAALVGEPTQLQL
ncbi:MAG: M20/M25/M40 family metallo-hydrolase, partial [Flavisolibacter sp.]|nr:M20/M25/M40 family metallo-hydrolase [Flavisolibacter sp.]